MIRREHAGGLTTVRSILMISNIKNEKWDVGK